MIRWRRVWIGLLLLACAGPTPAQAGLAAHEVLLLVNRQSPRSLEVANHFVHVRHVPPRNVIYLDLPEHVLEPEAEIAPDEFTRYIWEPVQDVIAERALDDHVLAWIYSVDFPVRITTDPPLSLMGMTFLRNRFPRDPELVDKGRYPSRLYAGPDEEDGDRVEGGSLVRYPNALGPAMPVPSMMLGFTGSRGTDTETVIRTLRYGQAADRSMPRGTVYWFEGEDIRASIREWQFSDTQPELNRLGVRTTVLSGEPDNLAGIIGLQMGSQYVYAETAGRHLPGSMAEHLTSHAASFHLPFQTKLTDWIRAGATASAGTVTEPYSIWTKFPTARFFAHYARGHTMLESFYLALRSPLQILLVGEPLARPWAQPRLLTLVRMEDDPQQGVASFVIAVQPEVPQGRLEYTLLLDGVPVSTSAGEPHLTFDTRDIADGHHELRVVSYARAPLADTAMTRIDLLVDNLGRSVRVSKAGEENGERDLYAPLELDVESEGDPLRLAVLHNERVLAEEDGGSARFRLDPEQIGAGPVALRVRAEYEDGMQVHSEPLRMEFRRPTAHPDLRARAADGAAERRTAPDWEQATVLNGGVQDLRERGRLFEPETDDEPALLLFEESPGADAHYSARMTVPFARVAHPQTESAGLVFAAEDEDHFDYFIMYGRSSAWAFGRYRNGRMEHAVRRGAPILRTVPHSIDLVFEDGVARAFINGTLIAEWADAARPEDGRWGLLVSERAAQFEDVRMDTGDEE